MTKEQAIAYAVIAMKRAGLNEYQKCIVIDQMIDEMDDFGQPQESVPIHVEFRSTRWAPRLSANDTTKT